MWNFKFEEKKTFYWDKFWKKNLEKQRIIELEAVGQPLRETKKVRR